jgi:hypothetical protein
MQAGPRLGPEKLVLQACKSCTTSFVSCTTSFKNLVKLKNYHSMQLRATSEPPQVPDQRPERRRIADPSRKAAMLAMLQIEPTRDNCAGYLRFPGKFRLLVKGDQWMTWSQDTTSIPIYILEGLHNTKALANTNNENAWMELTEENFRAGDNLPLDPSMVVSALRLLLRLIALARTPTKQSSALLKSDSEV